MHLVTSTLSRSISAMLRICHQIIELRLMPVCPARGRGTTTTWQRLLPPNQGDFQRNVNAEERVIWILPNRCSSSANRQSSVEAVAKFSQDDQGLWIERWGQCFQHRQTLAHLGSHGQCFQKTMYSSFIVNQIAGMFLTESPTWRSTPRKWKRSKTWSAS